MTRLESRCATALLHKKGTLSGRAGPMQRSSSSPLRPIAAHMSERGRAHVRTVISTHDDDALSGLMDAPGRSMIRAAAIFFFLLASQDAPTELPSYRATGLPTYRLTFRAPNLPFCQAPCVHCCCCCELSQARARPTHSVPLPLLSRLAMVRPCCHGWWWGWRPAGWLDPPRRVTRRWWPPGSQIRRIPGRIT